MSLWKSLYDKIRKPTEWIEIKIPSLKFDKEEIIKGKEEEE